MRTQLCSKLEAFTALFCKLPTLLTHYLYDRLGKKKLSSLLRSNPWCWSGVEAGVGSVQGLSLAGNQLQGELPGAALAEMRGLVTLDLSDNEIEGIP